MSPPLPSIEASHLRAFEDHLGAAQPDIELIRFDDCWRTLIAGPTTPTEPGVFTWRDRWGASDPYGHRPERRTRPLDFDVWGDPNTLQFTAPMDFLGRVRIRPATFDGLTGLHFHITIEDLRSPTHLMQRALRIPVGFRIPFTGAPCAFGLREMYHEPRLIRQWIDEPGFCHEWFYLEAELFGLVSRHPMDGLGPAPWEWGRRIHAGAPMAAFQPAQGGPWWAITGEPDYGAAIHWRRNDVLLYTTLYLQPGGRADWQACLWRQEADDPANVYLSATRPGGWYDQMNPPGLTRKGIPEGPIAFININRPPAQLEELRKVRPRLVILNYIYDHISSIADMYGEWTTYEGFAMTEDRLKKLIADLKAMGARVGYYGTSVEQPEDHKPVRPSDIVMDRWGRRFNAWEPGNWVVDAGNEDCAERLARTEAEFAQHYGLDCVFVDRLDHLSVNANPARRGCPGNARLECIPSVRLGMIELMKQRVLWQRRLNPDLHIGLNNTTQWAGGVRYSDFNLLEGGMDLEPPIFYLNAPHGLIHKQHYNILFCDFSQDIVDHGIVQGPDQLAGFDRKRRAFFRDALADGVIPQPYEDEIFVPPDSSFFKGWNNRELPDAEKWAFYDQLQFHGGDAWREDEDRIARAMDVARRCCFPVVRVWTKPEALPPTVRFSARRGEPGGLYVGVRNLSDSGLHLDFVLGDLRFQGDVEAGCTRAWFAETEQAPLETIHF